MKNLFEILMQAAKELEHKKLLKFLEDNANEATDNVFDLAADLYTEQSNSHKHSVSGKRPDYRSIVESIIVPQGYKIVHIGHAAEVSASQFLYKKQVEQLITELSEAACASAEGGTAED